jgi:hypothetical protein
MMHARTHRPSHELVTCWCPPHWCRAVPPPFPCHLPFSCCNCDARPRRLTHSGLSRRLHRVVGHSLGPLTTCGIPQGTDLTGEGAAAGTSSAYLPALAIRRAAPSPSGLQTWNGRNGLNALGPSAQPRAPASNQGPTCRPSASPPALLSRPTRSDKGTADCGLNGALSGLVRRSEFEQPMRVGEL